ncbi:glycosyltransferase [Rhodoblastus acidophilus]|uniref:Glycosyltransferase n=1 Tax=Candidatus Rhodoblastus alkanivorans TaxID=2954117 RepID=A0ABS9Z3M8_9HYPH|nr:glycosyltransferase [Candidatus Rhodoblastus alkanivorans]MCI4677315.1 glycosyltransferase [Candidatus Rhodoblastus alkanivorans]MCI4682050.1 glycosyltransferase [Candidatus Rhodoblastus alkanivorans]MDI4639352.1 glycosyltransferase [Rhodoblastus acidophilus]
MKAWLSKTNKSTNESSDSAIDSRRNNELRASGDRARVEGDWSKAAENYQSYLSNAPEDFEIWVQLGHALKEANRFGEARAAYGTAIRLRPDDFDVHLNLGHLEKLAGQRDAAITAYKRSFELNSSNRDALQELIDLGADLSDAEGTYLPSATKTIFVDMTDLMEYVKTNPSLSGIQRVVANLISNIDEYVKNNGPIRIVPVVPEYDNMRIFAVNRRLVLGMIDALHGARAGRANLDKAIDAVYASRKLVAPKPGDIFTIAGAFWIYAHFDMVRRLRESGVGFVVFIHDLIQISHPEYVHEAATLAFRRALIDVLTLANGVLTNSEFVAEDVRNFMRTRMNFEIPVQAVVLATELASPDNESHVLSEEVKDILSEPYVLSVSTIEVRKNHMYIVRLWEKLIANKAQNIPNLVFVGKIGWDIEQFTNYLANSNQLGGRLRVVHGVTDFELSELYRHAMFTMFPSFVEGFGLPVGESLAYGKPCVSSNRASMPEVGGKFARYINPDDVNEGYELVRDLLDHPDKLQSWTQEVVNGYAPKRWQTFASEYFDALTTICEGNQKTQNGFIEVGDVVGLGRDEIARRDQLDLPLTYLANARGRGWFAAENWGCWTSARRATLRFATKLAPNTAVAVYLAMQLPGETDPQKVSVRIEIGGIANVFKQLRPRARWLVADGKTETDGSLSIVLFSSGPFAVPDHRELFVGLTALAFCESADALSRVKIVEKITFSVA